MTRQFVTLLLVFVLIVVAVPVATAQEDIVSVCLVTDIGRVNDGTFNQYAFEGMLQAADEFDLDSTFIETASQTDYAANIQTCVDEDFDIVVTVGFLIADATLAAAEENPDVFFIGVDQFLVDGPENYVGIQFREDQAGFLVGVMAALVTETNVVAGVYGDEIPPVVKYRNGYEQGIAYAAEVGLVEDEVTALGVYIDDFQAPDRGSAAAEQFIGESADVIFGAGGPTGSGGILTAAQEGFYVIGVDQDEYFTTFGSGETPGVEFLITSALKRVDVGVFDMIEALINGGEDFPGGGLYVLSLQNGGIGFAGPNDSDIDEEFYEIVQTVADGLAAGEIETGIDPATGELLDE